MHDFVGVAHAGSAYLQADYRRCSLDGPQPPHLRHLLGIVDDGDATDIGCDLLKHLHQLAAHREFAQRESRDVAAGLGEAGNETSPDRIGNAREDNRNLAGHRPQSDHRQRAIREDDIRLAVDHLHRDSVEAAHISRRPMRVNSNVASLDPAQIAKLLNKSCQPSLDLKLGLGERSQYRYAPHALYLLRAYGDRPAGRGAAEQRDELATPDHVWMAPAWQEIIWRAAQRSLAVMCPAR